MAQVLVVERGLEPLELDVDGARGGVGEAEGGPDAQHLAAALLDSEAAGELAWVQG